MDDRENREAIEWLKDIRFGSRRSFDLFYKNYLQFVFQIAYHITGNYSEAEDVCQDVFLEVLQKVNEYNPKKGSVRAWLAVKTKSRSIDRLRKKKEILASRLEKIVREKEQGADLEFLDQIEEGLIREALGHLPYEQREAIIRSYFRGESHREIADAMEKPLGTVKSLIRYGLHNLRKQKALINWADLNGGDGK